MATRAAKPLKSRDIQGLKYFNQLLPLLDQLHDVGCQRDTAGNRKLHYDQYCMLVLLSLFNPIVRSLRALKQATELEKVQRMLGCERSSLGSLSEAVEVFDPKRLLGIIATLAAEVQPIHDVRKGHLTQALVAVDGSLVKTLRSIAEAAFLKDRNGRSHSAWRFHTHFDIDRHIPTRIEISSGRNSGDDSEKSRLRKALQPDHCYVMDRGYAQFTLWNEIVAIGGSYVCRIRDNSNLDHLAEERPVSATAAAAGVQRDLVVHLGQGEPAPTRLDHPARVILVEATPHEKRGGRKGDTAGASSDGVLRIATNLMDVPAEVIADLYRHRWAIELFFRFFKHVLGCRHLLSTHRNGIEIQAYCAIIACLLISLWTGCKPTLRTYEMICLYFAGWATLEELRAHIRKLQPNRPPSPG